MPVINGIKMACDACIRGHRSTKCDHGDSRVLMKVRKPGRPLTTCPHLQSQPCDCPKTKGCGCSSSITVAFPKKQGCGDCKTGPKTVVKTEGKPAGPAIPDVPAATAGTFKVVKKSAHLAAQVPRARPQSYDGTFFDGIDLNSVNIISNGQPVAAASTNGSIMSGMAPPQLPVHIAPALPNVYPQNGTQAPFYGGTMANGQLPRNSISKGAGLSLSSGDGETTGFSLSNGSYMNGNGGFMSIGAYIPNGNAHQPILTAPYPLSTSQSYSSSTGASTPATTVKSCCSGKTSMSSSPNGFGVNGVPPASVQQSYSTSTYNDGNSPQYHTAPLQPTYTYTETFARSQHQLQMGEWPQNLHMSYSQQPSQSFQQLPLPISDGMFQLPIPALDGNAEICGCGSDCQCLGCQLHPQNATTLAYVRNMNNQMSYQREPVSPITPGQHQDPFYNVQTQAQSQIPQQHLLQNYYDFSLDKDPLVTSMALKCETPDSLSRTESPQLSLNGSPFDSMGESQQQELDPSNYFMVDYHLGGGCEGDGDGCQCGDDCQCFGCTIHKPQQDQRLLDSENGLRIADGTKTPEEPVVKKSCCG